MTVRTDLVIDWTVSPRLIMVEAPSVTITVQDLVDTLRDLESELEAMNDKRILGATGKDALGGSRFVGITATLQDAQLTFEARAGPTFATCTVTDGNLVAVDDVGSIIDAIAPSDYTWVRQELDVSPGLIESGVSGLTAEESAALTFVANIEGGRWVIDEVAQQMIFYEADNITEVARFNLLDSNGLPTSIPADAFERTRA